MDMDKYFKELEEQKAKESENNYIFGSKPTHCPMCSRRCELVSPMCSRGVMFAQQNGMDVKINRGQ